MTTPPDPPIGVDPETWRAAFHGYLLRRQRLRAVRAELAAARTAGLVRRHSTKLARIDGGDNVDTGAQS